MNGLEALSLLIGILDQEDLPYMVVGSETTAWVAAAEDVVIQKLCWAKGGLRSKDFEDVVNVLIRQGKDLDFAHIERWCGLHGTMELLEKARGVAGE